MSVRTSDAAQLSKGLRQEDVVVEALKLLGGVAHLTEISAQCSLLGYTIPDRSVRRLLQQYSSDATWTKAQKPIDARDLFYSVVGVNKAKGFWGLRGFAVKAPQNYQLLAWNEPMRVCSSGLTHRLETLRVLPTATAWYMQSR